MFNFFHQHKFRHNEKGQFLPIFIVVIVVLIIMAMVTVNLSKVASIKTESGNAADAGSLAAASVMANVFNGIAMANSEMEAFYWEFVASTSVLFTIAMMLLVQASIASDAALVKGAAALAAACLAPCVAAGLAAAAAAQEVAQIKALTLFLDVVTAITIAIIAYSIATYFHFLFIQDMAEQGREAAIKMAHQFAFMNSGISAKLKDTEIPAAIADDEGRNNYQQEFSNFMDNEISHADEYTYAWRDGQARRHYVRVRVGIDPVDTFRLKTTVLPAAVETALLLTSKIGLPGYWGYKVAAAVLAGACACKNCCGPWTPACCFCWGALCASGMVFLQVSMILNTATINQIIRDFILVPAAWLGLLPGPTITASGALAAAFTICWIEDVVHNRKVRVDTWQFHQGGDVGLWRTGYPQRAPGIQEIHSFSIADFTGRGQIHKPVLRHDSSIVATDLIGVNQAPVDTYRDCPYAVNQVNYLEGAINNALVDATNYDLQANHFETEVARLNSLNMVADATDLMRSVNSSRNAADDCRANAEALGVEQERLRTTYPYCF